MTLFVKFKKLSPDAIVPTKATQGAAAYDVYAPYNFPLVPGRQLMPLDLSIELPDGYEAKIEPRSGMSLRGLAVASRDNNPEGTVNVDADVMVGKIDSDYRGNIGVLLKSNEDLTWVIRKGTRIAQLTVYKVEDVEFREVWGEELNLTERGEGGFGSTGK